MKNGFKLIFSIALSSMLLTSCGNGKTTSKTLDNISVHDIQTVYEYNADFVKPGVTATFSDKSTEEVVDKCDFTGFDSKTAGRQTVNVSYTYESVTKTTSFAVIIKEEVVNFVSMELSNKKETYNYGEEFVKPTVTASFSNGTQKNVTEECTFVGFNALNPGNQTIIVTYTFKDEPHILSYDVKVLEPVKKVESIAVSNAKTDYKEGDAFEKPTVTATFNDSTNENVTDEATFEGFDSSNPGNQTITVKYKYFNDEVSTSYEITVTKIASKARFAIFADVQLCNDVVINGEANTNLGTTANASIALKSHLEFIKAQKIDTILMNGDITNQANEYYYSYFEKIVGQVYGNEKDNWPEFVWNMGNHEWWWGITEKETGDAVSMFRKHARIQSDNLVKESSVPYANNPEVNVPSYYKVINGVPVMVISAEASTGKVGTTLANEIKGWLNEIKELDSVKAGGPIFVEYHYALSTSMTYGQGSSSTCSTVEEIFKDTPNAVIFTGDTHYPGVSERSINQVNFTTINLGSSSYSRMVDKSAVICNDYYNVSGGNTSKSGDMLKGGVKFKEAYTPNMQIIDVKENNSFVIDRYFTEGNGEASKIGPSWSFSPIKSKSDFTYTNDRFQKVESAQKLYGKDGLEWLSTDKVTFGVNEKEKHATILFPDVTDYHCVEHYLISVNDQKYDVVSNYYSNPKSRQNNYYVLEDIDLATTYNVEVTAYDFYDNPSTNTLKSSTNEPKKAVETLDYNITKGYTDISVRNEFDRLADENSSSALEYYYKGKYEYKYGAIASRLVYNGNETDCSKYLSFNDETDDDPVLTLKAKATTKDDLIVGITLVIKNAEGGETWKTDFGVEYQKSIKTDNAWHEFTWNLKNSFGITKKSQITNLTIKVKSTKNDTTNGYEMGVLFDNVDLIQNPKPSSRGYEFTSTTDLVHDFKNKLPVATSTIEFDVKFTSASDTKISIALIDTDTAGWKSYFGYFDLKSTSKTGDYNGLTVSNCGDGYIKYVFNLSQITKHNEEQGSTFPVNIKTFYVKKGWTTATGYIDIITQ